jgi:hypothetical protein
MKTGKRFSLNDAIGKYMSEKDIDLESPNVMDAKLAAGIYKFPTVCNISKDEKDVWIDKYFSSKDHYPIAIIDNKLYTSYAISIGLDEGYFTINNGNLFISDERPVQNPIWIKTELENIVLPTYYANMDLFLIIERCTEFAAHCYYYNKDLYFREWVYPKNDVLKYIISENYNNKQKAKAINNCGLSLPNDSNTINIGQRASKNISNSINRSPIVSIEQDQNKNGNDFNRKMMRLNFVSNDINPGMLQLASDVAKRIYTNKGIKAYLIELADKNNIGQPTNKYNFNMHYNGDYYMNNIHNYAVEFNNSKIKYVLLTASPNSVNPATYDIESEIVYN